MTSVTGVFWGLHLNHVSVLMSNSQHHKYQQMEYEVPVFMFLIAVVILNFYISIVI